MATNAANILDQFTRQAEAFAGTSGISDPESLDRIVALAGATSADVVLDVGCGPGIVVAAYARVARRVTGIDLTPAMLDQARLRQRQRSLTNVQWVQGDMLRLPFPDACFSIVNSRFALHHCPQPLPMLLEMRRVCRPGGRVVVTEAAPAPAKVAAYNAAEKLRDPSHERAFSLAELVAWFAAAALPAPRVAEYRMPGAIEDLLGRSFPLPGDGERLRALYRASLSGDPLDMALQLGPRGDLRYAFPVAILSAARG